VTPLPPHPIQLAIADTLRGRADELHQVANAVERDLGGTITYQRLLSLAAPLIAELAQVERTAHQLAAWLPQRPAA